MTKETTTPQVEVNQSAWQRFLDGHWTLEQPQQPGTYRVAARHTTSTHCTQTIGIYVDPNGGKAYPTSTWSGWWWSEAIPALPATPDEIA